MACSNKSLKLSGFANSAAETLASIEDLLIEILLRVPTKSLLRLKSISKQWHSLINDTIFNNLLHIQNPRPATGLYLILDNNKYEAHRLPLSADNWPIPKINKKFQILQSCNGLLLCSTTSTQSKKCSRYFVHNPTMNLSYRLPELDIQLQKTETIRSVSLAFDPNKSPHYKVVCVVNQKHQDHLHIYSSDTGLWKPVEKLFNPRSVNSGAGVYWNGAIHWLYASVLFDIEGKKFHAMPSPPISSWRTNYYFGESCDKLLYAKIFKKQVGFEICVYRMEDDYSSWSCLKHIPVETDLTHKHDTFSVLSVVLGEDEEDSFVVFQISERVMRKSFSSNTREEVCIARMMGKRFSSSSNTREEVCIARLNSDGNAHAFQYIETTCCVKSGRLQQSFV